MRWEWLLAIVALVLSTGLSLYLTPIMRAGAVAFAILDRPDGRLKQQAEPVPYLGGLAIYLAFLLTLGLVYTFHAQLLALLLGATLAAMLGLFDDFHVLSPSLKLLGQVLAAWVLIKSNVSIQLVALPAWVELPLSVLWLVGMTNALNILDVFDGLMCGVAAIAASALSVVAILNQDWAMATTGLALAGSLAGFWRYNRPPAQIYAGDTGSLFVGVMLGALAMIGAYTRESTWGAFAPIAILLVPVVETTLVILTRIKKGRLPWRGSPDHLALRLRNRGWSDKRILAFAYGLGLFGAGLGIAITLVPAHLTVILDVALAATLASTVFWLAVCNRAPDADTQASRPT